MKASRFHHVIRWNVAAVGGPREEPIAVTLKLPPDLYLALKRYGMRTKPRKTNQEVLLLALQTFLQAEGAW